MPDSADQLPLLNSPPPRTRRVIINLAAAVFLCSQVAIPVSYYLGDEPTSERFSWRMFSSIDLSTWDARVTAVIEDNGELVERPVPLAATLQETNVKIIQEAQLDVVEPLMRRISKTPGVHEVRFEARRTAPRGKSLPPIRYHMKPNGPLVKQAS